MKNQPSTAITQLPHIASFAVIKESRDNLRESIEANLGGRAIQPLDLDRVTFPTGGGTTWEVPTLGGEPDIARELIGIIIAKRRGRLYYDTPFDGQSRPPTCYSDGGGVGIGSPGGECRVCPLAQWGSGENGGQACSERELILLLRETDIIPIVISIPPTSIRSFDKYLLRLVGQGRPYWSVISKLTLTKAKSASGLDFSQLVVSPVTLLTDAECERVKAIADNMRQLFTGVPVAAQ